eukprot:INCI9081.1.p1 GENE.INCI9081.1~~INCI9081.1.p1  ORF type:complete len:342 (+),score=61.85 INCI9081.1:126-1151(+)
MKTRTEFKKNHVGAIAIRLDRFYYAPGDTVTGSVLFNCTQPAVCEGLVLKFTGKEEAEWEDRRTRTTTDSEGDTHIEVYYEHVEKDHTNFKTKVKLSPDGWVCQPGSYQFPFQITVPATAPGSLDLKWARHHGDRDVEVEVVYKLKATLDVAGKGMKDLKAKVPVTVFIRPATAVTPAVGENTANVMFCGCVNKGSVAMTATFDKNAYRPGEMVNVLLSTTNQSSVNVNRVKVKLMRRTRLRTKREAKTISEEIARSEFAGVPAGESREQQPLQLQIPMVTPTSVANLVECVYRIDVECDLPMAPDIEIQLPVVIYASEPQIPVAYAQALSAFEATAEPAE